MPDLRVERFNGGITDNYRNGELNRAQYIRNFDITRNGKLKSRGGIRTVGEQADTPNNSLLQGDPQTQISGVFYWPEADNTFLVTSGEHIYYHSIDQNWVNNKASGNTFWAPGGNPAFYQRAKVEVLPNAGISFRDSVTFHEWRDHVYVKTSTYSRPCKVYPTGDNFRFAIRSVGLPGVDEAWGVPVTEPTVTLNNAGPGVNSYIYALAFFYEYQIADTIFLDAGPVWETQVTSSVPIGTGGPTASVDITLNAWVNNTTTGIRENWDFQNIVCRVYRTKAGQLTRQLVGEINYTDFQAGAPHFTDTTIDANLGVETLYTTGGVQSLERIPESKYMTITNDIAWYANLPDAAYRVRQSMPLDPDASPETYTVDFDETITGISAVDRYPIVFARDKIYRLEGSVDRQGRGNTIKRVVSTTVGCISNASIVQVERGLYFAAEDGFYYTDGYQVQKLSEHLNERYRALTAGDNQKTNIRGALDRITGKIYWAMSSVEGVDAAQTDNDVIYILDPYWGRSTQSTFTTLDSEGDAQPSAITFHNGILYLGDKRGVSLYIEDTVTTAAEDREYKDVIVLPGVLPQFWIDKAIPYYYQSPAISFGTETNRKLVTKLVSNFRSDVGQEVDIISINDDDQRVGQSKLLKPIIANSPVGPLSPLRNFERRFPAKQMRCTYKTVAFQPARLAQFWDEQLTGTPTATPIDDVYLGDPVSSFRLDDYPANVWDVSIATNLSIYTIHFSGDNYNTGYGILTLNAEYLTIDTRVPIAQFAGSKWEIRSVTPGKALEIESYTIQYTPYGTGQGEYSANEEGGNA